MKELPFGAIIATAELVGCHPIIADTSRKTRFLWEKNKDTPYDEISVQDNEFLFGDWTPGRYAWELRDVKMLAEPIPAKGKQRLWYVDLPDDVLIKESVNNGG